MAGNPSNWTVHKLKEVLSSHSVDITTAREKDDLLTLLHQIPEYKKFDLHHPGEEYGQQPMTKDEMPHYYDRTAAEMKSPGPGKQQSPMSGAKPQSS